MWIFIRFRRSYLNANGAPPKKKQTKKKKHVKKKKRLEHSPRNIIENSSHIYTTTTTTTHPATQDSYNGVGENFDDIEKMTLLSAVTFRSLLVPRCGVGKTYECLYSSQSYGAGIFNEYTYCYAHFAPYVGL